MMSCIIDPADATSSTDTDGATGSNTNASGGSSKAVIGSVVGATVGAVLALFLVLVTLFLLVVCVRRRKKSSSKDMAFDNVTYNSMFCMWGVGEGIFWLRKPEGDYIRGKPLPYLELHT